MTGRFRFLFLASAMAACAFGTAPAPAADVIQVPIRIQNHRFLPAAINVPAGREIRLVVKNADKTPEVFESKALRVEREIPGGKTVAIKVAPLEKGKHYKFAGKRHVATAQGELIAK